MAHVPQELVDAILEHVPDASLPACSLTATAFVLSSQRRLFRWMSLRNLSAYERTATLLASSPHLGQYVRLLALQIQEIPADCAELKAILALLPGIERLSISGGNAPDQVPLEKNPCLVDFLSTPSIKCFSLNHFVAGVPRSLIIRALSTFEQVSLSLLAVAQDDVEIPLSQLSITDNDSGGAPPPPALWHLNIRSDQDGDILPMVLHSAQLPLLKSLVRLSIVYLPVADDQSAEFNRLLTACSATLEHLEIELERPLDLPALPALVSMQLWIDVDFARVPEILAALVAQTTACASHLETLTIELMDRPKRAPQRPLPFTRSAAEWPALDSALMDMRELQSATFSLRHFELNAERYAAFVPYIEQKLPRAFDADLLLFSQHMALGHPMDCFIDD